jgi:hypothetical protein
MTMILLIRACEIAGVSNSQYLAGIASHHRRRLQLLLDLTLPSFLENPLAAFKCPVCLIPASVAKAIRSCGSVAMQATDLYL